MTINRTCDGIKRRDMLRAGALTLGGLTLAQYTNLSASGALRHARAERAIFIELPGGPSHLDTFDMKPECAGRDTGVVQSDRYQRAGYPDFGTPAETGTGCRQVRNSARCQPYPGSTPTGPRIHQHGQQADPLHCSIRATARWCPENVPTTMKSPAM